MKSVFEFVLTTLKGGILVILPLALLALLVAKAVGILRQFISPLVRQLPAELHHPTLAAVAVLILGCFIAGLLTRTEFVRRPAAALEKMTLARIPGYAWLRSLSRSIMNEGSGAAPRVALVVVEEALVPAFIVERHADGQCTVFVPSPPSATSGSIYILPAGRVHALDVPFAQALRCVTRWGMGSGDLLRAMEQGGDSAQGGEAVHKVAPDPTTH